MIGYEQVEILLVEDSETDAEISMRALGRKNLANNLVWVKDVPKRSTSSFAVASTPRDRMLPRSWCSST
jgi:hypothetical protein